MRSPASLTALQEHRKVTTVGACSRRCNHEQQWAIDDLIAAHKHLDDRGLAGSPVEML
jgi:hypothetical protein